MTNAGIDYGMGSTNRDSETGIRYGVISQHDVSQAWAESSEGDYGKPCCPKCGNEATEMCDSEIDRDDPDIERGPGCADYVCESCQYIFDSCEAFPEEALGYSYEGDGYQLTDCLDSDIFVLKSPYYTFAQFCSPCVPGAGNLNSPMDGGAQTYCLGHDWFDEGRAPYPVFSVATGEEIHPDKED